MTDLTTPQIADACVRLGITLRCAPQRAAFHGSSVCGPAVLVHHIGSVDVILEALESSPDQAVLVVDDDARTDRACIGDLVAIEALHAGASGIVVNGCHRDTTELAAIGLGVYSLGSHPAGPTNIDTSRKPNDSVRLGDIDVTSNDWIVADADGVIVVAIDRWAEVAKVASEIRATERRQAAEADNGRSLRSQFEFATYLKRRAEQPSYGFRHHLATIGASIEE